MLGVPLPRRGGSRTALSALEGTPALGSAAPLRNPRGDGASAAVGRAGRPSRISHQESLGMMKAMLSPCPAQQRGHGGCQAASEELTR